MLLFLEAFQFLEHKTQLSKLFESAQFDNIFQPS